MKQTQEVKAILKEIDRRIKNSPRLHPSTDTFRINELKKLRNWITTPK